MILKMKKTFNAGTQKEQFNRCVMKDHPNMILVTYNNDTSLMKVRPHLRAYGRE